MSKVPLLTYISNDETLEKFLIEKVGPNWSCFPKSCRFQLKALRFRNKEKFDRIMSTRGRLINLMV